MLRLKYSILAAIILLATLAADVTVRFNSFFGESNGSTILVLGLQIFVSFVLILFSKKTLWKSEIPKSARALFIALMLWNFITLVRGAFIASDYWAWKSLLTNHLFISIAPLFIVLALNIRHFQRVQFTILSLMFPLCFLLIPITLTFDTEMFQRAALPVYLSLLFLTYLNRRWYLLVLAVAATSLLIDFSYRSNTLRIFVALALGMLPLLRNKLPSKALNLVMVVAFITPLLLLFLGIADKYNVFRDGLSIELAVAVVEGGEIRQSPINADTRTFLYDEVLTSMKNRGSSFIAGQGAATGYESIYFSESIVGTSGRGGSEVGFLNTLMYSGAIGVFLYAALLCTAAIYSFNRSNNDLCKVLGLFLLFKWVTFFIEDIPKMDLNFFCIWIIIGLCLSTSFRQLNNAQVRSIFRFKHPSALFRQVQAT